MIGSKSFYIDDGRTDMHRWMALWLPYAFLTIATLFHFYIEYETGLFEKIIHYSKTRTACDVFEMALLPGLVAFSFFQVSLIAGFCHRKRINRVAGSFLLLSIIFLVKTICFLVDILPLLRQSGQFLELVELKQILMGSSFFGLFLSYLLFSIFN